jgi:hypothetical protein
MRRNSVTTNEFSNFVAKKVKNTAKKRFGADSEQLYTQLTKFTIYRIIFGIEKSKPM